MNKFFRFSSIRIGERKITKRRTGVSPVIATTIILAITISLGLALFSYVNSQTNVATKTFADEATDYINYRNDRFVVVGMGFKTQDCAPSSASCVTAYLFNNGNLPVNVTTIFAGPSDNPSTPYPIATPEGFKIIEPKNMDSIPFDASTLPSTPGESVVYHVKVQTATGSYHTYFQKYEVPGG